jgi:hypothetical protein
MEMAVEKTGDRVREVVILLWTYQAVNVNKQSFHSVVVVRSNR